MLETPSIPDPYAKIAEKTLLKYFGYQSFRPGQLDIVRTLLKKNDALIILPTGGGKSICFQVPGLIFPGVTLVISPLISLMKDQVDTLIKKNILATYLNSTLPEGELESRLREIRNLTYKFVYVAPERLQNEEFIQVCQNIPIDFVAIDEAHCVSMWGHDFRPSYKRIPVFFQKLSRRPIVAAFTATATHLVQNEISTFLQLQDPQKFTKSFLRDNLTLYNFLCSTQFEKEITLLRLIQKHRGESGIIYTSTRKKTEYLAQYINFLFGNHLSGPVLFYHGGMSSQKRAEVQEAFLNDKAQLIIATNAFGMGVDKSNIRYVIHYQIPGNLENYYQEAGRAGRDRHPAFCYLLSYPPDLSIQVELLKKSFASLSKQHQKIKIQKLKYMIAYAKNTDCLQKTILKYFGENIFDDRCTQCSYCLRIKSSHYIRKADVKKIKKIFYYLKHLAKKHKIDPSQIMSKKVIHYMVLLQPQTKNDFLKIPGIGNGWIEQWHDTIQRYLEKECPL